MPYTFNTVLFQKLSIKSGFLLPVLKGKTPLFDTHLCLIILRYKIYVNVLHMWVLTRMVLVSVGIAAQFLSASSRLANASPRCWTSHLSSRSSKKKKPKHQIIPRLTTEAKYTRSPSTPSNT